MDRWVRGIVRGFYVGLDHANVFYLIERTVEVLEGHAQLIN